MPTETKGIDPQAIGTEIRLSRMGRENVETKGRRLLIEGRLDVRYCAPDRIQAFCRGTEETHRLGWEPRHGWGCSCPAKGRCSHLVALQLVAQRPDATEPRNRAQRRVQPGATGEPSATAGGGRRG